MCRQIGGASIAQPNPFPAIFAFSTSELPMSPVNFRRINRRLYFPNDAPPIVGTSYELLSLFEIAPVTRSVLEAALADECRDFEDAVLCRVALHVGATQIVTHNPTDFKTCTLPIVRPRELVCGLRAG